MKGFTGIWLSAWVLKQELPPQKEKLLGHIEGLDQGQGCWASNGHFARILRIEKKTVSRYINELVDAGLLHSEVERSSGKTRRRLTVLNMGHWSATDELNELDPKDFEQALSEFRRRASDLISLQETPTPIEGNPLPQMKDPPPSNEGDPLPQMGETRESKEERKEESNPPNPPRGLAKVLGDTREQDYTPERPAKREKGKTWGAEREFPSEAFAKEWRQWAADGKKGGWYKTYQTEKQAIERILEKSWGDWRVATVALKDARLSGYQGVHPKPEHWREVNGDKPLPSKKPSPSYRKPVISRR